LRINRIIIPAYIVDKLQSKHQVSEEEVHETLRRRQTKILFVERGEVEGEDVYLALGRATSGRYLSVFFIYKKNRDVIVISARDMAGKERNLYGKK